MSCRTVARVVPAISSDIGEDFVLRPRERFIYMFRFQPTVRTERVAPPSALDLLRPIQTIFDAGLAVEEVTIEGAEEGAEEVVEWLAIRDMEIDERDAQVATLLFTIGDRNLSDTVFEHRETGEQRVARKRAGEGVSFAAHLVIALEPDEHGSYPMLLEEVPYLSRTRLIPFMKRLIKNSGHAFEETDENGHAVSYVPSFHVDGDMSQRLQDELDAGRIRDVELVRTTRTGQGLDENGYYREATRQIKLKVDDSGGHSVWEILRRIKRRAREENMDTMRVRYTRADDKNRTITHRTGGAEAYNFQDALNVRCELVEFLDDLPNSRQTIDPTVRAEMLRLMRGDAN